MCCYTDCPKLVMCYFLANTTETSVDIPSFCKSSYSLLIDSCLEPSGFLESLEVFLYVLKLNSQGCFLLHQLFPNSYMKDLIRLWFSISIAIWLQHQVPHLSFAATPERDSLVSSGPSYDHVLSMEIKLCGAIWCMFEELTSSIHLDLSCCNLPSAHSQRMVISETIKDFSPGVCPLMPFEIFTRKSILGTHFFVCLTA